MKLPMNLIVIRGELQTKIMFDDHLIIDTILRSINKVYIRIISRKHYDYS